MQTIANPDARLPNTHRRENSHKWVLQDVEGSTGCRLQCAECGEVRREGVDRGEESMSESRAAILANK